MKISKQLLSLVLIISLLTGLSVSSNAVSADNIGSLLDSYTADTSSVFTLTNDSRIFIVSETAPDKQLADTASLIARQIGTLSVFGGKTPETVYGKESMAAKGDILLVLDKNASVGDEGYVLDAEDKAVITAKDTRGLIYGAGILMKIFASDTAVTGFSAENTPDTKQRVVMLDTGRKYFSAEWIKNFIRQLSWMGYNTLELHFSEDGGFRADFWDEEFYADADGDGITYEPENDFSWLCGSHVQSWVKEPYRDDADKNRYLTTAELVDICAVAKEYQIDIIPSFDSPSHMDYITWKFEQNYISNPSYSFTYGGKTYYAKDTDGCINYTGKTGASSPTWPYYTTIDITDGTMSKAFIFALYEDIADFFSEYAGSTDFSIGADEVNLSNKSIVWEYSAFPGYINEINRLLNEKGYTCRMFNDFIGSTTYNKNSASKAVYDFDENIEIMYWTSDFNPSSGKFNKPVWHVKFFWETNDTGSDDWGDGGRIMYNCMSTNCYYVLRVAASTTGYPNMDARNPDNRNWTFYGSTEEDIYNKWYPADISAKGVYEENAADVPEESLGGAYFLIWNDYASLNTEAEIWNGVSDNTGTSDCFYSLFDRMWSNSIKMWNADINNTVAYDKFADIRSGFGYFPGFTSCSTDARLPTAPVIEPSAKDAAVEIISIEKISDVTPLGKKTGFVIITSVSAESIDVSLNSESVELTEKINSIQTRDNKDVRVWYINFEPVTTGTYDYRITVNGMVSQMVSVTVV